MQISTRPAARAVFALGLLVLLPLARAQGPCDDVGHCQSALWSAGSAPDHRSGAAVAIGDGFAAVGSAQGEGVHIYQRVGSQWQLSQTLVDPEGPGNGFGKALAIDGARLFVGAPDGDYSAIQGFGAGGVHVYQRIGNVWSHHHKLVAPTPWNDGHFGAALAAHNQWVVIGAPDYPAGGYAYVWSYDNGGPVLVASLYNPVSGVDFGHAVAIFRPSTDSDAYVAIGDPSDSLVAPNAGVVGIARVGYYHVIGVPALRPEGLAAGDRFGASLSHDGVHLVVGAPGDDQGAVDAGAAYVYDYVATGNPQTSFANKIVACNPTANARFGSSVLVRGNRAFVGAPGTDGMIGAPKPYRGAVHVYQPGLFGAAWIAKSRVAAADPSARLFGSALAFDGPLLVVGAPGSVHQGLGAGAAYLHSVAADSHPGGTCASAHLSTQVPYGVGKPGTLGVPTITLSKPPTPGSFTTVAVDGLPQGTVPLLLVGLAPTALPFDDGLLLVAGPHVIAMPAIGITGKSGLGWNVGTDPAVQGIPLFVQVMALDPGAGGPFSLAQSAGLAIAVGW